MLSVCVCFCVLICIGEFGGECVGGMWSEWW